jgi:hypothetical protein
MHKPIPAGFHTAKTRTGQGPYASRSLVAKSIFHTLTRLLFARRSARLSLKSNVGMSGAQILAVLAIVMGCGLQKS